MEKVITFSNEEKSLIWQRFIQPVGGTEDEARHFIEVCEMFGLNPLLGDIVFQRYETRNGPRVNFITTRDGLLRVAMTKPDYVGAPNSAVVREGDQFKLEPSNGSVEHEFGTKRGKILGAWARMEHKRFRPVCVFVDFEEYFKANAQSQQSKGGSPVWDSMPSAMIQKVAEVFVLRRQFPLGGLYTAEELGIDNIGEPVTEGLSSPNSNEEQSKSEPFPKNKKNKETAPAQEQQKKPQKEAEEQEEPSDVSAGEEYTLVEMEIGKSPSGVQFAKIFVKELPTPILAKGEEGLLEAAKIEGGAGEKVILETYQENGFTFLKTVASVSAAA